ncbi:MAG: zinc-ribbon domain-containing protein [Lysobacter sp.]|nr:zinc-ribbon domain-containing protein [Lysobacter sp.]
MSERKSGKQRREEIRRKRVERAERLQRDAQSPDVRWTQRGDGAGEAGVEPADRDVLARLNNPYATLPDRYIDTVFECRDCGEQQVWTAKQQKWWYEVAQGAIDSRAVRCLPCRRKRRDAQRAPGADRLRETCERIRALGERAPDTAAREAIDAALADKWWGVRTVAIGVLGRWGDAQAVARLKALVDAGESAKRWGDWASEGRRGALKALGECLPASEIPWALAVCLQRDNAWPLPTRLAPLPLPEFWQDVFAEEWRRNDPARLQRLTWLLRGTRADIAQQTRWRNALTQHEHKLVRQAALYAWRDVDDHANAASR